MQRRRFLCLSLFALGFALNVSKVSGQSVRIVLVPLQSGLIQPVYLTNAHDGTNRRYIVEQPGRIRVIHSGSSALNTPFLDISNRVLFGGERGLLGLAFHPQFASNGRFFVDYTRQPDGATVIAEYRVSTTDPNVADTQETVLLVIPQPYENHNGGMVEFGPDGYLYIGMGDGGSGNDPQNRAQNVNELLGKILRIDVDRSPIVPSIFALGMRNPWRFSFDRATGQLYAGDVGQNQREEVDIVTAGGNYGWRVIEGSRCTNLGPASCSASVFIPPIAEYDHSTNGRCSVSGGYVYRGAQQSLPYGAYVYGDYCSGEIFMLQAGIQSVLLATSLNISSFGEDESGELYVVDHNGSIYRITNPDASALPTRHFELADHGAASLQAAGGPNLAVGYVRIQTPPSPAGNPNVLPGGLAIFAYRQGGVLVSEVSVPAAPLVSSGRTYAEVAGRVNTGIAIANPNAMPVTIDFYFTDTNGNNFGQGSTTIDGNRQIAAFLNQPPFNAVGNVRGTFTFTSSLLVSAIALRGFTNERSEFLMTSLPIARVAGLPAAGQTIPYFATGGGWTSSVVIVNPTGVTVAGELRPYATNGQPLALTLNGSTSSVFSFSIPPRGSATFGSEGSASDVQVASIRITPIPNGGGPSAFAIVRHALNGVATSEASVPADEGSMASSMFVESLGNFNAPAPNSIQSGVAVANPGEMPVDFHVELYRSDGTFVGVSSTISLPAHGQTSMFLNTIPGLPTLPPSFQGLLRVVASGNGLPIVAVSGLRRRYNERGNLLTTTTSPFHQVHNTTTSELLFPHFAIGGGYEMQFVLFSDNGSTGTVYFLDQNGNPRSLPLR